MAVFLQAYASHTVGLISEQEVADESEKKDLSFGSKHL